MAQHTRVRDGWILRADEPRGGRDLLGGWPAVLVVAGERYADAARIDHPIRGVPTNRVILQQSFAGAVRADQPVVGEKDHPVLAEMPRPDRLSLDTAPQYIIFQILQTILAQQPDRIELFQRDLWVLFSMVQHDGIEHAAFAILIRPALGERDLIAFQQLARQGIHLMSPGFELWIIVDDRKNKVGQFWLKLAVPIGRTKFACPISRLELWQHRILPESLPIITSASVAIQLPTFKLYVLGYRVVRTYKHPLPLLFLLYSLLQLYETF